MKSLLRTLLPGMCGFFLLLVCQMTLLCSSVAAGGSLAPVVSGITPTNDNRPTWSWTSGGADGVGTYRYHEETDDFSGSYTTTTDTWMTAPSDLADGSHTLYVQEYDGNGGWSTSGSFTIVVDRQAPNPPVVPGASSTQNVRPTFTWSSGGGGNGIFRYHEEADDFSKGFTVTPMTGATTHSDLADGTYTLYVQEMDDAGNWSASSAVTVTVGAIAVTYPTGATILDSGDNITVTWSSAASVHHYLLKYSLDNGASWQNLGAVLGTENSFAWTLPVIGTQAEGCLVNVVGRDAAKVPVSSAVSAAFTLLPPANVALTSLNSGEILTPGESVAITWDAPVAAATVDVYYTLNGGANWKPIGPYAASLGVVDWQVPVMFASSDACKIGLLAKDAAGGRLSVAKSAIDFSILGSVNLNSPQTGDVLAYGQETAIDWSAYGVDGMLAKVVIKFSQNGGSSWSTIANLTGLDMTAPYPWTPQGTVDASNCQIMIQFKDASGAVFSSDVEGPFSTIEQPISLSLSQASITEDYQGLLDLTISDVPPGGEVYVEQLIDADQNGLANNGDIVVRAFYVVDGEEELNPNIPADTDGGLANGTIVTQLDFYDKSDIHHSSGKYVFRATKTKTNIAQKPFTVTPVAASQTISGKVTDNSGPVAGAIAHLVRGGHVVNTTLTDQNGEYIVGAPEAGDYHVVALIPDGYHLTKGGDEVAVVTVTEEASVTGVNRKLRTGDYKISGRITDSVSGEGIEGVTVDYEGLQEDIFGVAITDKNGNYTAYVPAGTFEVLTYPIDTLGLHPSSKGYEGQAEQFIKVKNVSANVSGINFTLNEAVHLISGTVRDDQGTPVAGVPVIAEDWQDDLAPNCMTVSDAQGNYTLALTSGQTWSIGFGDDSHAIWNLGYVGGAIYNYTVEAGPAVGNDLTVYPITGFVEGTVEDQFGAPIDAWVDISGSFNYGEDVDVNGYYWVPVSAGTWYVDAKTEWEGYPAVASREVSVANMETQRIDFVAGPGGIVAGTVTDEGGQPIPNIIVVNCIVDNPCSGVSTDDKGQYQFNLAPDVYEIGAGSTQHTPSNFIFEWYLDQPITGTPVVVTQGSSQTIDFVLELGGTISGRVTDQSSGQPLANAHVYAQSVSTGDELNAWTDGNGNYSLAGIAAGTGYLVSAGTTGYELEFYNNTADSTLHTPVAVSVDGTTPGIDFSLSLFP